MKTEVLEVGILILSCLCEKLLGFIPVTFVASSVYVGDRSWEEYVPHSWDVIRFVKFIVMLIPEEAWSLGETMLLGNCKSFSCEEDLLARLKFLAYMVCLLDEINNCFFVFLLILALS